jgi:hypothetical protein
MIPQPEDGGASAHANQTSHAGSSDVNIRRTDALDLPTPSTPQVDAAAAAVDIPRTYIPEGGYADIPLTWRLAVDGVDHDAADDAAYFAALDARHDAADDDAEGGAP